MSERDRGSYIVRAMSKDGSAKAEAIISTSIVNQMVGVHHPAPTSVAAMGRLLSATSIIGTMLKQKEDAVSIVIDGDGPIGKMVTVSDYCGNVRGYMQNPAADLPVRPDGKLDVKGVVGKGVLRLNRELTGEQPYVGMVELKSGEIAEDIANYFVQSEQIPTLCALGVLVSPECKCLAAGGVLVQLLPFYDPQVAEQLEQNASKLVNLSRKIEGGLDAKGILKLAFDGIPFDLFDEIDVSYLCTCSRERMKRNLYSLGRKDLTQLLSEQAKEGKPEELETVCHFCNNHYTFGKDELMEMFS
ncbi:MAG: Hsp33 family molecular chaperone HslO [Clostridia bacterium]|nr:Hsp33 family molecular chaperone HslO [Clostridia bacterium]